jgi:K+-transporting ATPase ATPase C chain
MQVKRGFMFMRQLKPALVIFVILTVLTGIVYPLAVTVFAQVVFPRQANGSMIEADGRCLGSTLIGQPFDDPKYFWGRLSATSLTPCNAAVSSGSNLAPLNPALPGAVKARIEKLRAADPDNKQAIPVDLVTSSASGLDPHISVAAAMYQAQRVTLIRHLNANDVTSLITKNTQGRLAGVIGEPVVNVLQLNLDLDNHAK